jgi:BMFP domain-containing protein YqiC
MKQGNFIDDLTKRLHEAMPPGIREIQKDWEKNIHAIMQAAFAKLDLVTREEFDAQASVLAKTRHKLEMLEKRVAELEKKRRPQTAHTKAPHKRQSHKTD